MTDRTDARLRLLYDQLNRDHEPQREQIVKRLSDPVSKSRLDRDGAAHNSARLRRRLIGSGLWLAGCLALALAVWQLAAWSPQITLADVQAEVAKQTWMLLRFNDGEEHWTSLATGREFYKEPSGRVQLFAPGLWQEYIPPDASSPLPTNVVRESRATPEQMQHVPRWTPKSPWDYLMGATKDKADVEDGEGHSLQKRRDTLGGRAMIAFEHFYTDALRVRRLCSQMWVDVETRLPVRCRKSKSVLGAAPEDANAFVQGMFSFPDTGPRDIYDLGVPRDVRIVRVYDDPKEDPEVRDRPARLQQLLADAERCREEFPSRYRLLLWPLGPARTLDGRPLVAPSEEIHLVFWDGKPTLRQQHGLRYRDWTGVKIRQARYFNNVEVVPEPLQFRYELPFPATGEEVLKWTAKQTPVDIEISDGDRTYSRHGPYHKDDKPTVRVARILGTPNSMIAFNANCWPQEIFWPYFARFGTGMAGRHELVTAGADLKDDTVLLRITDDKQRFDDYLAPDRDWICVTRVWWKLRKGEWVKDRQFELSNLRQFPNGRWWASQRYVRLYGDPEAGVSGCEYTHLIDIVPLDEFPAGAFDGEAIVRQAGDAGAAVTAE